MNLVYVIFVFKRGERDILNHIYATLEKAQQAILARADQPAQEDAYNFVSKEQLYLISEFQVE